MRIIGDTKIFHWSEIEDDFRNADIFLGNGFSININPALNYRSLFGKFLSDLQPDDQILFRKFGTTNFEEIQTMLSNAAEVNAIFGHEFGSINEARYRLKSGLIKSINVLHPPFSQIDPRTIFQLSQKLDWFGNIYTTNYDTFLYHIVLTTLDRARKEKSVTPIQDFFRSEDSSLVFIEHARPGFRSIYYLHGALFITTDGLAVRKIKRGNKSDELMDLVRLQIHTGHLPLFVSEGTSLQKQIAIDKNNYLAFCQRAFRTAGNRMVIHGFSFSNADDHLRSVFNLDHQLAIGIYMADPNKANISHNIKRIEAKLSGLKSKQIRYFDSGTLF